MNHLYDHLSDDQLVALFLSQFSKDTTKQRTPSPGISFVKLAQAGRAEALYKIGMALLNITWRTTTEKRDYAKSYIGELEFVMGLTPNPALAEALLRFSVTRSEAVRVGAESRSWSTTSEDVNSFNASLLACGQQRAVLLDTIAHYIDDERYLEILSFLLQELIIRGARGADNPALQRLHAKMQEQKLPLAWLPLELSTIESDIVLHEFVLHPDGGYGGGKGTFFLNDIKTYSQNIGTEQEQDTTTYTFTEINTEPAIHAAVFDWEAECRVFSVQPPLALGMISPQLLLSLQLECLEGAEEAQVWVQEITPQGAFECLYRAAAFGGAYSWGQKGARGRLEAWYSLTGLVGAPKGASFEDVLERVRRSRWFFFLGGPWFKGIWELGLLAIRPERDTLAVLAATDTD